MSTAIKIQGLKKEYSNKVQALKGINLEIQQGDFFALLGANGAGKTTIINILTSLVNKTEGKVEIFGHNIDTDFDTAKTFIGVVPQEFNFNMFEKVIDIVINQAGYYGIPAIKAKPKALEILNKLGLGEKKDATAMTLSGGMKRRLMIARSLIHEPKLLILDEPTAGVDVELRIGMWDYLRELNEEQGVTILLTTHYLEEVEQLCYNAAIIKNGEIIMQDSVKKLIKSLDKEIYVLEIENLDKGFQTETFGNFVLKKVDDSTVETTLDKANNLNSLLKELSQRGIQISGIRPKGNRLEELFLGVLKN